MTEAVVVLPVFFVLFVGVFYLGRLIAARHAVDTQARSCAWLYAANDCEQVPPQCEGRVRVAQQKGTWNGRLFDVMEDGARQMQSAGDAKGVLAGVVGKLLGPALDAMFGKELEATESAELERPPLFGGDTTTLSRAYRLSCNVAARTPLSVAKEAWQEIRP